MSCVIACKDKDKVFLVADSRSSTNRYNFETSNQVDGKIARAFDDEQALIGHVGDTRDITIIKQIPGLFNDFSDKHPEFDYHYIRNVLMDKVRNEFLDLNIYGTTETHKFPTRLLVARKDKLFLITECGAILKINNFTIEGSGTPAALGCYSVTKEQDPLKKALKAMQAAIKYNNFCGYPILVASTRNNNWYALSEEDTNAVISGGKELDL